MIKLIVVALALALALVYAQQDVEARCGVRCYAGTVKWEDGATPLIYTFSVLPCAPSVVISAHLGGHDATETARFECVERPDVQRVALSLVAPSFATLEWVYEAPAGETCAELLAAIDTLPTAFVGTHHRASVHRADNSVESLGDAQVPCEAIEDAAAVDADAVGGGHSTGATSIDGPCYDTGVVMALTGRAAVKSPCGAEGSSAPCALRVLFSASRTNPTIDVLVGSDAVSLRLYRPEAVSGEATIECTPTTSEVAIYTSGVRVEFSAPTDHSATCESMFAYPDRLATGRLSRVMVRLGADEVWVYEPTASDTPTFASLSTECTTMREQLVGKQSPSDGVENGIVRTNAPTADPVTYAIKPFVTCSSRVNGVCCSVFGYTNPNGGYDLNDTATHNYFVPSPAARGQPIEFSGTTTVAEAFAVIWDCPEYKRHTLRWIVKTPALLADAWENWADASRDRNDCTTGQRSDWCEI